MAKRQQQQGEPERPHPPIVVQIVPAPKSQAEVEAETRDNKRRAESEGKALVTNVALAFFAFLQVCVTGLTLLGLRHTKRAADETKRSVDTLVASERAYVFFLDTQQLSRTFYPSYQVVWRNFGKTPAVVTGVRLGLSQASGGADPATMPKNDLPIGAVIGADGAWPRGQVALKPEMLRASQEEARPIWLCGQITYRDIHGKDHRTWFCRLYTGAQFILDDSADEAFNGYD